MWGFSGRLGMIVIMLVMPKSNGIVAKAATRFVGAGLAADWCECN